ncbi:MAG TPA: hypothetical protein VLG47_07675 [Candidatus Saccharimonadales bacterium]|nr:hypothetical protein [Candidatus Saccharimonadales bacterium]
MIRFSQKLKTNKLVLGFAGASVAAVVGAAGFAAAAPNPSNGNGNPAIVAFCKDHFQELGYKNLGQCVSALNQGKGHGYGNTNTVTTTVTNNVSGDNNFIETVINNIF